MPTISDKELEFLDSWKGVAEPYSVVQWANGYDYAPLGIGHLRVENSSDYYHDWAKMIILPVWRGPNKNFYAWIYNGLVHPSEDSSPYALTGAGMVETGYEHQTFIVTNETEDGWLKLRLKPGHEGEVWIHKCYLWIGKAKLFYQSWEEMMHEQGDWLHFRANIPHALRLKPTVESQRITWIGLNHELTLLEIKDDWMRVRVRQPAWTCVGSDKEFQGSINEGWVKWKDPKSGPWVWFYTRGC